MTQSSIVPLLLATTIAQQLQAVLDRAQAPCLDLKACLDALLVGFLSQPITPAATLDFEISLRRLLDECGRSIVESVFNHIEPEKPQDAPKHTERDRLDYVRKNEKSRTRGGIATLFGTIELRRCLYEPLQLARDNACRSFAPLELCLGIVAGNATPALAERVGRLAAQHTQQELLDVLQRDHHVHWSVTVLRSVTTAVSAGIAPYLRDVQKRALLGWLAQAWQSRGRHRPTLAVGRDGIMLPIRHEEHYKEGGVATLSVYDRRGRRLGTLYLGEMPEPKQLALSAELTALVRAVLADAANATPRLVYVTDAGYHQTTYFEEVLSRMENPRQAGQRLVWLWVVDYYHAASYVSKLARVLFEEEKTQQAWARRMRHVLRDKDGGVIRVLHSAAQLQRRKRRSKSEEKQYQDAYNYLLKHSKEMAYSQYRRAGLPIGSGVTEAGCKVVFTQRFKDSGMTWSLEGGEVILRLRLAVLSRVWDEVYREFLNHQPLVPLATTVPVSPQSDEQAA
jgi:hypothetical protein